MKLKCLEKIGSAWFIYKKFQVIPTLHKVFEYNFLWNCLEFSDKTDLTIQAKIFNNAKRRHAICLNWRQIFYVSNHVRAWSKSQYFLYNQRKSNFI